MPAHYSESLECINICARRSGEEGKRARCCCQHAALARREAGSVWAMFTCSVGMVADPRVIHPSSSVAQTKHAKGKWAASALAGLSCIIHELLDTRLSAPLAVTLGTPGPERNSPTASSFVTFSLYAPPPRSYSSGEGSNNSNG
ncbi:hypothetical protein MHYP_G00285600 [Metynnis hypsauchen]